MSTALTQLATRLSMNEQEVERAILKTVMPSGKPVTPEQFVSFIAVANEYNLNPLVKEIYAFPARGGIQPMVSIDGWLRIINNHHDFDGMVFDYIRDGENLIAVTCRIFKKNCRHPVEVTEYMKECYRPTETWRQWPTRMLRHKATMQAGRYAFGISGIIDPDEEEHFEDSDEIVAEKEINPTNEPAQLDYYPSEQFNANFPKWSEGIESGKVSADQVISKVQSKAKLTEEQINTIQSVQVKGAA